VAKLWASAMNLSAGTKQKNSAIAKLIRNQPAKRLQVNSVFQPVMLIALAVFFHGRTGSTYRRDE